MTAWGYARVSTAAQDLTMQLDALTRAGVDAAHIVTDQASGTRTERPGLDRLLADLKPGDVLTVWKLDRVGRSTTHLVALIESLGKRGVEFRSLTEGIDTTTSTGRLLFHIVAAVAQFERELVAERTAAALAARRASGAKIGRPSPITPEQVSLIHQMHEAGASQEKIRRTTGLSRSAVGRVIRGEIASLGDYSPDPNALPLYPPTEP